MDGRRSPLASATLLDRSRSAPSRDTAGGGIGDRLRSARGEVIRRSSARLRRWAAIGPHDAAGRRFGRFGEGSIICAPSGPMFNERYIHIGRGTMIGPDVALSAGLAPGQVCVTDPVVSIGDRCLIGRGSGVVGHLSIIIGDDVWTGHQVYITDQNHGYERLDVPISRQLMPERPVVIGDGAWLGHGSVVLPGATIGRHVVVAANSVVTGALPDHCVAAGAPARVIRQLIDGEWREVTARRAGRTP
jgi:acetyltransferase-like isoleucine patch superfamily enzyme